jgi:sporulation protein YlmC with PRC-barrel domain
MKKLLATACAVAALSVAAFAQTGSKQQDTGQPAQNQTPSAGQSGTQSSQTQSNQKGQPGAAREGGAQSGSPTPAVRPTFYTLQPADLRVSKLMDAVVYNPNNENMGEIEDVIIDNGKNVKAIVVGVGGFLGIGDRNVAIAPESVTVAKENDGSIKAVVNTNKEELKKAPEVNLDDLDKTKTGATTGTSQPSGGGTSEKKKDGGQSR